ncbi:hypothetical protein SH580_00120 [Coraliomargarita algicola]|uniref:Uncharacterized protein n=1 Tax=Coraliomargarita algicola TaxID=3092156 RepID=A0ABZ0RLX9_9BACT|nr:hypothetical protein [Coraliomargarita sp. J2-16]WPJ96103.1 hypothetical protein SH580_00120 [Coraliomargarita sp. J2-16]
MTEKIQQYLFMLATLCALTFCVNAQNEEEPIFDVNFSIYIWPQNQYIEQGSNLTALPELGYQDIKGIHWFQPREGKKTATMHYTGPNPIRLFTKVQEDEIGLVKQAYTELKIPANNSEFVAFVFPQENINGANGTPLKMSRVMNLDPNRFKEGEPLFVNFSTQEIAFKYGKNQQIIPAGGVISLPVESDGERSPVMLATKVDNEWVTQRTTSLSLSSKARSLILLEPYSDSKKWKIIRIVF